MYGERESTIKTILVLILSGFASVSIFVLFNMFLLWVMPDMPNLLYAGLNALFGIVYLGCMGYLLIKFGRDLERAGI